MQEVLLLYAGPPTPQPDQQIYKQSNSSITVFPRRLFIQLISLELPQVRLGPKRPEDETLGNSWRGMYSINTLVNKTVTL